MSEVLFVIAFAVALIGGIHWAGSLGKDLRESGISGWIAIPLIIAFGIAYGLAVISMLNLAFS